MHQVQSHGAPKITMRSDDYKAQLKNAKNHKANAFINGVQEGVSEVFTTEGAGLAAKGSRHPLYGNVNVPVGRILQGELHSNFEQRSTPGNKIADDPYNQTGDVALQTSATKSPQRDPEDSTEQALDTSALERRLDMYKKAGNAYFSNNDRSQTMRLPR